jgi:hypothetical protein
MIQFVLIRIQSKLCQSFFNRLIIIIPMCTEINDVFGGVSAQMENISTF